MSSLRLPVATRTTAFIAGASLAAFALLLDALKARGVIPYDADSPQLFPVLVVYFFVSVLMFVIDLRSIAPKELKTRFPGFYFPTNREGVSFILSVWGRMIVWFIGAVVAAFAFSLVSHLG
jgi:hypothetical protein